MRRTCIYKMLSEVYRNQDEFDLIHAHTDTWTLPFAESTTTPTLLTTHGRLDLESFEGGSRVVGLVEHRIADWVSVSILDAIHDIAKGRVREICPPVTLDSAV